MVAVIRTVFQCALTRGEMRSASEENKRRNDQEVGCVSHQALNFIGLQLFGTVRCQPVPAPPSSLFLTHKLFRRQTVLPFLSLI